MRASRYLPSKQFSVIVVSLLLSAGLVYAADAFTTNHKPASIAVDTQPAATASSNDDWQSSLSSVEDTSGVTLPPAPDQNTVDSLLQAAKSSNVTDTISRTLLVNLTDAEAQGLGDDTPTQNQIVQSAMSQITPAAPAQNYSASDLNVVADSTTALHQYGNALATVIIEDTSGANEYAQTMLVIDNATSQNDSSQLQGLSSVQAEYQKLVGDLVATPVPQTMQPFHLELVQDFAKIAATYPQMETLISDPVQGLSAVQQYNTLTADASQMFTNIAQQFSKNDILFTKDEPGASWALLLQDQTTSTP